MRFKFQNVLNVLNCVLHRYGEPQFLPRKFGANLPCFYRQVKVNIPYR